MIEWLLSGELPLCLSKLKEMDAMLKPVGPPHLVIGVARPLRLAEDKLSATMVFFDKHKILFHFLLTPDIWDRRNRPHRMPQLVTSSITKDTQHNTLRNISTAMGCDTETEYETEAEYETASEYEHNENNPLSARLQAMTRIDRKNFLHTQQKLVEVSRWLAPLDCTEKHTNILKLRQEGTCEWFPKTDAFKKWRAYGSQFLWLHGKAGCGKSVLIASTIEHLKKTVQDEEVVVFFYCDFRNERSTSSTEVIRSVLSQLICHIRDCGVDPGDLPNKILEQKSDGSLSLNDLGKLGDLVSHAASRFRYEPVIVIDALDECADMESLLRAVVTLKEADVRLLVTSRPHQMIMDHFKELRSLSTESVVKDLAIDISLHVRQEIGSRNQLRFAGEDMKDEVHTKLTERAEGRFRWVQCQLDTLDRCSSRPELRQALDNLPNELETTYEKILGAIDERKLEGELARRALTWLVVALEPLRLTQVVNGLSVVPKQQKVDRGWLRGALLNALSSLVVYTEETDVLALSHFSVKEYLIGSTALPMYRIILHGAHSEVAQMCMRSISVFLKAESSCRSVTPLQFFPMLSYVLSSGFIHLAHVDPHSATTLDALQCLRSDVRHHPSHWELLCELRDEHLRWPYPPWPSSRHDFVHYILIAYSSPGLLKLSLSYGYSRKPRIKTNPLVYAADLRKTEHAKVLLAYGADVNKSGLVVDDCRYALSLDIAIDLGEDVLVGELLRRGSVVTSEVLTTAVCMPWCSSRVLLKLMQTDEFVKWAHEIGDEKLYRGVFNSARPNGGDGKRTDEDHVAMARILRQIGQNLSADSRFGAELVERALHAAHTSMLEFLLASDRPPPSRFLIAASTGDTPETISVVRFLLGRGVDIHAISDRGRDTALHLAVMCPWEPRRLELVQLLMEAGCDPTARNLEGKTAFALAIKLGYSSALELLFSYDVSIPSDILPFALQERSALQVVEFLIQKGADLHSTFGGNTIFHLAVIKYPQLKCLELVKSFIKAGCTLNTTNSEGKTIFEVAMEQEYTMLVELLVSFNIPLPPDILLVMLRKQSHSSMIEFLIRKGADLRSTTPSGDTVLHLAIAEYPESESLDVVQNLIKAGCNHTTSNSEGKTAVEVAIERSYSSVLGILLSYNFPFPSNVLLFALQKHKSPWTVKFLIRKGANLHSTTSDGDSVFHLAIAQYPQSQCLDLAKSFMEAGCTPNIANSEGKTVLEVAIEHKYTELAELLLSHNVPLPSNILLIALQRQWDLQTVEFLISQGANLYSTSDGNTIFHLAITKYQESDCWYLMKIFMQAGCNPDISDSEGRPVFEVAIERKYLTLADFVRSYKTPLASDILLSALRRRWWPCMIDFLIQRGANLHCITSTGDTVLHLAIGNYNESDCRDFMKTFINAGCDPAASNFSGQTVFEVAIAREYISVAKLLVSYNAFPPDVLPIMLRKRSAPKMVKSLIHRGANVHPIMSDGNTIFHLIIAQYPQLMCLDLVKGFVDAGSNPNVMNSEGQTVFEFSVERKYIALAGLLLSYKVPLPSGILPTILQKRSDLPIVEFLIQQGADLHSTTPTGDTIHHLAITEYCETDCWDLVQSFVKAGCYPVTSNSRGRTVLETAVERRYTSVVQLLLSYDPPFPSNILPFALPRCGTPQIIKYLILRGADVHCMTSTGDTVLHLAITQCAQFTCLDLVKRFIKAGCNPSICNSKGLTALETALQRGYVLVVDYLLSCGAPCPSHILPMALWKRLDPWVIGSMIQNGADVHSMTPNGESTLYLAINAGYSELACLDIVKILVNAGCNVMAQDSDVRKAVLEAAIMKRGYTSVAQCLLLSDIRLSSFDVLSKALQKRCGPQMIRFLARKCPDDFVVESESHWDTLLRLVRVSYTGQDRRSLVRILSAAREAKRTIRDS